jgi:hypothetical protein
LQLLLGAIGALPQRSSWKLGLMLSIQDAQAFGKELTEAVVGYHDIGINDNLASTRVEIDVLGVREKDKAQSFTPLLPPSSTSKRRTF